MTEPDRAAIIQSVCETLLSRGTAEAAAIMQQQYPFAAPQEPERKIGDRLAMRVLTRDGFLDRYSGQRLLFPAVLRILTGLMRDEVPFQINWKMSETHQAYWELMPTFDHIIPASRGGTNTEGNLVTTSMFRNSAKANWTPEEIGWTLQPPGDVHVWDGLMGWSLKYVELNDQLMQDKYIGRWVRMARVYQKE